MRDIDRIIELALQEDIGPGDITTDAIVDASRQGKGIAAAKENLVAAGIGVARRVFEMLNPRIGFEAHHRDGEWISSGAGIFTVTGDLRTLLTGERVALNFLQHLSGVATQVRSFLEATGDSRVRLVDTRKTTPGLRSLEKYAVRMGGGHNHRMGLYDGVLIKDNHIAVSGGVKAAVERARMRVSHLVKIEVEVTGLSEVHEALDAGADVIMLDNMDLDSIRESVKIIDGRALVEVSGMVGRGKLKSLAESGVDIVSAGALTHSARSMDISMTIGPAE